MIFFYHFSFQNMKIQWVSPKTQLQVYSLKGSVGKMGQSGSVGKRWGKILNIYIFPSSVLWKQNSYRLV